jgi:hypothetical protein
MSLRETLLQILSADRRGSKPELIEHGTILMSPPHSGFHLFFHVRDDADMVVRWTATHASPSKPEPISMAPETRAAIAQFLASISAEELALATTDRPLRRIDEARFSGFEAFAIAHPSLNPKVPADDLDRLLATRGYWVFPCFTCEVADEMDAKWASFHYHRWSLAHLTRKPQPAVRVSQFARPQGKPGKPKARSPYQLVEHNPITRALRARQWLELENWRNRVVRFADGKVTLLCEGPTRALAGRNDAIAIEEAFLARDQIPETAQPPDPIPQSAHTSLGVQFEATAGDLIDGVEPVEISEIVTDRTVLRLWLTVSDSTMSGEYEIADERLDAERVVELFKVVYLAWFTRDHWRKEVATIVLAVKGDSTARLTFPYPPPKESKPRR